MCRHIARARSTGCERELAVVLLLVRRRNSCVYVSLCTGASERISRNAEKSRYANTTLSHRRLYGVLQETRIGLINSNPSRARDAAFVDPDET